MYDIVWCDTNQINKKWKQSTALPIVATPRASCSDLESNEQDSEGSYISFGESLLHAIIIILVLGEFQC